MKILLQISRFHCHFIHNDHGNFPDVIRVGIHKPLSFLFDQEGEIPPDNTGAIDVLFVSTGKTNASGELIYVPE